MNFIKLTQYGDNAEIYVDADKIQVMVRFKSEFKKSDVTHEYTNIHMSAPVAPNIYFIHVNETPEEIMKKINRYRDEFIDTLLGPEPGVPQQEDEQPDCDPLECYDKCDVCYVRECGACDGCDKRGEDE